eukprot:489333-Pelagomonas_calceolata.AAC.2
MAENTGRTPGCLIGYGLHKQEAGEDARLQASSWETGELGKTWMSDRELFFVKPGCLTESCFFVRPVKPGCPTGCCSVKHLKPVFLAGSCHLELAQKEALLAQ